MCTERSSGGLLPLCPYGRHAARNVYTEGNRSVGGGKWSRAALHVVSTRMTETFDSYLYSVLFHLSLSSFKSGNIQSCHRKRCGVLLLPVGCPKGRNPSKKPGKSMFSNRYSTTSKSDNNNLPSQSSKHL